MGAAEEIRRYWDDDAATYDRSAGHRPTNPVELAAWRAVLTDLVGPRPLRVLDVGAGTGFLALMLAELGHAVTAVDTSAQMLEVLRTKTEQDGLSVEILHGDATDLPEQLADGFDLVTSRHLLWLLPDPVAALQAWRRRAAAGRLLLIESQWGPSTDVVEKARRTGRELLARARHTPPDHHDELPSEVLRQLPLSHGPSPAELIAAVTEAGWTRPLLRRLDGVEWAMRERLPWPERMLGVTERFAILADG